MLYVQGPKHSACLFERLWLSLQLLQPITFVSSW